MNLNKFTISESKSVLEAIDVINKSGSGFVLTKKNNSISGILTDGDIRRILLKKKKSLS